MKLGLVATASAAQQCMPQSSDYDGGTTITPEYGSDTVYVGPEDNLATGSGYPYSQVTPTLTLTRTHF